ncbi:serine/threonine-protein phosphatase [Puniceicoccales bacterium CK1056]|uniref:Serine/threonine-protein phosphatase n=1 Tax=Oceanipulchritudo coccoides TaxID=2706888 RepID=A0A6B2M4S5_9BACT|nr:PP2C family serine/threonine-protein phosphatase [Oceanipulchritudo coccoides]NDV63282.1 serine/threonine-protein phosphatase [Oceanipulchritudo coccoides]
MIKASFGLTETGSVRRENQDSYLVDPAMGLFAVADGLGGLPNGDRASKLALDILKRQLREHPQMTLEMAIGIINEESRKVGYEIDESGFGTTLTIGRYKAEEEILELVHIGDSAAYLVTNDKAHLITVEHTVAARMIASQFEEACEAIPASAHHTLTQCIGQDLYIDPQVAEFKIQEGDRLFLLTDGVTKALDEESLRESLEVRESLESICQTLTFRIEVAGSPDNYTIAAVEF